jgi:hypothetical protein
VLMQCAERGWRERQWKNHHGDAVVGVY